MEDFIIGWVTLNHSDSSKVLNANFVPSPLFEVSEPTLKSINEACCQNIDEASEMVFGAWFAKLTEIELADREEFVIQKRTVKNEKTATGSKVVVEFVFKKRSTGLVVPNNTVEG